ncbi:PREDICTED: uncharacterized protein LOC106344997 [Brassica oleracea var. oleracea]|uniref:Uncharacterized protein n=2 Tax=Brassica TaxID=3705 RepID=A0A0D3CHD1_BRAOL|nr:PREDICTED: uncharacterized protein LOC106344997 [Brassica oleracea var. oleracea]
MRPELRSPDSDRDPPSSSTARLLTATTRHLSTVASPKSMTKKIDRNTDGLLKLNMISFTIPILFSHKLGINRYGSTVSVAADNLAAHASGSAENRAVEKTAFDVKLEKFEAASKIKVNKEIRAFTELGLKGVGGNENPRGTTTSAMFEQQPAFKSARKILESAIGLMLNRECSFREQRDVVAHRIHRTHL